MRGTYVLEKKILSDLKELPPTKVSEVIDFIEYLKMRQKDWKERFKSFLKKIEPKMKKVTYSEIAKEIVRTRGR
jgi:hypothetical protein